VDTCEAGSGRWENDSFVDRDIGRLVDGRELPTCRKDIPAGHSPSVSCQCVQRGGFEVVTFTSTAWTSIFAVGKLCAAYARTGRNAYPIVRLSALDGKDNYGNYELTLKIVGWANKDEFARILPPERPAIAPPNPADILDDDGGSSILEPPPRDESDPLNWDIR
jgi:hypothetical protein